MGIADWLWITLGILRGLPPVSSLLSALVGFEIPIQRIEGKFKFNQNLSRVNRAGVVAALEHSRNQMDREVVAIMQGHLEVSAS